MAHAFAPPTHANGSATGARYDEQRFSPLARLDDTNVTRLRLAWAHDLDTPQRAQESTPLVIDGVMYVTSAW
ncbi:MAG: hypothetical protein H7Y89_04530, partial [Steroidobacteraceae bacterium]|nr:hypothetical protein [Steroidobacteraceae bacterium]